MDEIKGKFFSEVRIEDITNGVVVYFKVTGSYVTHAKHFEHRAQANDWLQVQLMAQSELVVKPMVQEALGTGDEIPF